MGHLFCMEITNTSNQNTYSNLRLSIVSVTSTNGAWNTKGRSSIVQKLPNQNHTGKLHPPYEHRVAHVNNYVPLCSTNVQPNSPDLVTAVSNRHLLTKARTRWRLAWGISCNHNLQSRVKFQNRAAISGMPMTEQPDQFNTWNDIHDCSPTSTYFPGETRCQPQKEERDSRVKECRPVSLGQMIHTTLVAKILVCKRAQHRKWSEPASGSDTDGRFKLQPAVRNEHCQTINMIGMMLDMILFSTVEWTMSSRSELCWNTGLVLSG